MTRQSKARRTITRKLQAYQKLARGWNRRAGISCKGYQAFMADKRLAAKLGITLSKLYSRKQWRNSSVF